MGAWLRGLAIPASAAILLISTPSPSTAQPREETQEEFNARARAQQEEYARLQEAERAAREQERADNIVSTPQPDASGTDEEITGLRCLNDNRASVELPPLNLREFREGRAAGMIASPADLCNQGIADDAAASLSETAPAANAQVRSAGQSSAPNNDLLNALIISFFVLCAVLYFVPSFIAFRRGHQYRWIILALNATSGWTGIAWVSVFVWAIWPRNRSLAEPLYGDATGIDDRR